MVHLTQNMYVGRVDWYCFLSSSTAEPPTAVSPWIIVGGIAGGVVLIGILVCICGTIIAGVCIHTLYYKV